MCLACYEEPGYLWVANERSYWSKAGSTGLPRYLRPPAAGIETVLGGHGRLRSKVAVRNRYNVPYHAGDVLTIGILSDQDETDDNFALLSLWMSMPLRSCKFGKCYAADLRSMMPRLIRLAWMSAGNSVDGHDKGGEHSNQRARDGC